VRRFFANSGSGGGAEDFLLGSAFFYHEIVLISVEVYFASSRRDLFDEGSLARPRGVDGTLLVAMVYQVLTGRRLDWHPAKK
jgi:hypothetical protein